jgi:hypothetical protein
MVKFIVLGVGGSFDAKCGKKTNVPVLMCKGDDDHNFWAKHGTHDKLVSFQTGKKQNKKDLVASLDKNGKK